MTARTSPVTPLFGFPEGQNVIGCFHGDHREYMKMNERARNVYENKASLRKTGRQSRNVYENKGT
jgi:hypothetical protein